ncbi:hypothetical protein ACWDX6_23850 [Streptomyces sp. NPDC003027]
MRANVIPTPAGPRIVVDMTADEAADVYEDIEPTRGTSTAYYELSRALLLALREDDPETSSSARMVGASCPDGPGGRDCHCCGQPPGKFRRVMRRARKRSERQSWRRTVR